MVENIASCLIPRLSLSFSHFCVDVKLYAKLSFFCLVL